MGGAERDSLLKKNRGATGSGLYFRPTYRKQFDYT